MSFTAGTRPRGAPVLPLAGMIDILFLLLIFFMTISAYREVDQQIDVSLPATESGDAERSPTQIVITITADDAIFMSDRRYDADELVATLAQLAAQFPEETVLIRGDSGSRLETAVAVMDAAYRANLSNVYLATAQPADRR